MQFIRKKEYDFAVIGGGMAGISAAVAAARRGLKVCILQDRPVLGGNASEEIRMWIRGASDHFPYYREGGILEELALDNAYFNPDMTYPLWSGVLYNKVTAEKNIDLHLNTVCLGAKRRGQKIVCVEAFCLTSYEKTEIYAKYFADCSGDCILAESAGADFTSGRESKIEFGESLAKDERDACTMGNSLLLQAVETDAPVKFTPPPFAKKIDENEFRHRLNLNDRMGFISNNYWWIELGGDKNTLTDAEEIRRELYATVYGVWDFVKNSGKFDAENWDLHFLGSLPAKRETRRYLGDYVLTQKDIDELKTFPDEVAYGGWTMDDHSPFGMKGGEKPNTFHPVAAPYPIPWRCLYSRNVENLAFAGRNISVTHMALSSARVMATCALEGQAAGTGVAYACAHGYTLRETGKHIADVQQALRNDDCYLLHTKRRVALSALGAATNISAKNLAVLENGVERELSDTDRAACFRENETLEFTFAPVYADKIRLLFDSDIASRERKDIQLKMYPMRAHRPKAREKVHVPSVLVQKYSLSVLTESGWKIVKREEDNRYRLNYIPVGEEIRGIRFSARARGGGEIRLFGIDVIPLRV